jgi:hypothetical protein
MMNLVPSAPQGDIDGDAKVTAASAGQVRSGRNAR